MTTILGAMRTILTLPDERLRGRARKVRLPDRGIVRLAQEMADRLTSTGGIGLAAPQLGEPLRLIIVAEGSRVLVLANPEFVVRDGRQEGWEGCLSVPGLVGWVERAAEVVLAAQDLTGRHQRFRRTGLMARAFEHELAHLDGRLYVDGLAPERILDTREQPVDLADRTLPGPTDA
ncbi:MAG: peptide deformylase [Candidatus Limnocylindrales bacterium]